MTIKDPEATLRVLKKFRGDMPKFAVECLKVKAKSGAIVPLSLNAAQVHVHRAQAELRRCHDRL